MNDTEIRQLILQYYNGSLDDRGARRLASWLASSPEAAAAFREELAALAGSGSTTREAVSFWDHLSDSVRQSRRLRAHRRVRIAAAASAFAGVAVLLVAVFAFMSRRGIADPVISAAPAAYVASEETVNETETMAPAPAETRPLLSSSYASASDSRLPVVLPDGTEVTLNRSSRLVLADDFGGQYRDVTLDGEAFFEVAKDASRPFRIHCGKETFVVKGTSFNIMSYSGDHFSVVTLHTGSLQAMIDNDSLMLDPGDELRVDEEEGNISRRRVDVRNSTRWLKDETLHFTSLPLKMVAAQIGHRYGVRVCVHPSIADILYDGAIDNEPLEVALRLLAITAPERLTINVLGEKDYYITKQ